MIDAIQAVTDLPISVDSPSTDVLTQAFKFCNKPGLFNSVSGEGHKIDAIFPILAENPGWQVIALLSDDTGIPKNAADRLKVFDKIMAKAKEYGISPSRIHIDPLGRDALHLGKRASRRTRRSFPPSARLTRPSTLPPQSATSRLTCRFVR